MSKQIAVLLIEDNPGDARLVENMLSRGMGSDGLTTFHLSHFERLNDGLRRLAEADFDIILADLSLPDSHGAETFRRLREVAPDIPLVVLSGNSDTALALQAVREGAQDYLDKNYVDDYVLTRAIRYAIERKQAADALRESESLTRAILNSLTSHIAVLDHNGKIIAVNDAWERFARANGDPGLVHTGTGVNYLDACRRAAENGDELALDALAGLRAVLSGAQTHYTLEYPCHSPTEKRWFVMHITPLVFDHGRVVVSHENATARQLAEEAVHESERRFRALIEKSSDGVVLLNPDGTACYVSPAAVGILGYPADEMAVQNGFDLIHPDDLGAAMRTFAGMLAQPQGTAGGEFRLRNRDGSYRWLEATASNHLDEPGLEAVVVNYRDVTERKRAEEQIRYQAALIEQVSDAIIATDFNFVIKSWNGAAGRMFGYTAEEMIGRIALETLPAAFPGLTLEAVTQQVIETGSWQGEMSVQRKDGGVAYALTSGSLLKDAVGRVIGFLSVSHDITERKLAEEAVRQSEKRFRALIENSADAIALVDAEGVLIPFASPAAGRILGYTMEENAGRNAFGLVHPDDRPLASELLARLQRFPERAASEQLRLRHKSGAWRWVEATGTNLLADPSVRAIVVNYRDITARREAEQALERHVFKLGILHEISTASAVALTEDDLIARVTLIIGAALYPDNFGVMMLDEAGGALVTHPSYRGVAEGAQSTFPLGQGITGRVAATGRPLRVADVPRDPDYIAVVPQMGSELCVPMKVDGRVIGVINAEAREPNAFADADEQLLLTIAGQLATAIQRARLFESLQASERKYRSLVEQLPAITYEVTLGDPSGEPVSDVNYTTYVSPQVETILGFSPAEWLSDPGLWLRQVHPDDREWLAAQLREHDARGEPLSVEYRALTRDGRAVWFRNHSANIRGGPGQPDHIHGIMLDISERKQRERELEAVATMSAALRLATTRDEMLPVILDQVIELLNAQTAALMVRDPETGETVHELTRGRRAEWTGRRLPPGRGFGGHVIATGRPYLSNDVKRDPHANAPDAYDDDTALICAPLIAQGETFGALPAVRSNPFTEDELRLLVAIADIAASAIRRAALHEETRRRADQLAAINQLGRALSETLDLPHVYEQFHRAVVQLLPDISTLFISTYSPEWQIITCVYGVHDGERLNAASLPPLALEPPGAGPQSEAIRERRPVIVGDLTARLAAARAKTLVGAPGPVTQSALYAPMLAKGEVTGVVQVQSYTPNRFTEADAELLNLVAGSAAIAIENARLFAETRRRLERLQSLRSIDTAITGSVDLRITLNTLLDQAVAQLGVDAADVLLLRPYMQMLEFAAGRGFRARAIERSQVRVGEGLAGRAAFERRLVSVSNLADGGHDFRRGALLAEEGFAVYYAVPVLAKGGVRGVLEVFNRSALVPDHEWVEFLETLAGQAAIAIENSVLFSDLQRSNAELTLAYDTTLEGWSRALDLRDRETEGHTQRVTEVTLRLAQAMGLNDEDLVHVRRGALLHDIGKMGVPDSILLKPGPLTEEERAIMRRHPEHAYNMLLPIAYLRPALDIPYSHHERWDGSGYPRGTKGAEIPLTARIFAVADVWDALRSDRPYRQAWPEEKVRDYIAGEAGRLFDPQVVEVFSRMAV